ncbi:hypothetical protein J3E69DRAFT_297174 [Trichoderma sp. SZMC 28015]
MAVASDDIEIAKSNNELFFPTSHDEVDIWLKKFASSQDGLDPTQTSTVYAPEATLRFSTYPAILGASKIEEMVKARFASLILLSHTHRYFDLAGSRIWAVFDVRYCVRGDPSEEEFLVPCACVFTLLEDGMHRGKIIELEVFMDQTVVEDRINDVARAKLAV